MSVEEESVFDCPICMRLLIDPVSTGCGHTFCRDCISRSLDYRQQCPTCRAPCSATLGVNVLLSTLIRERFPGALAARELEANQQRIGQSPPISLVQDGIYPTIILESKLAILPGLIVLVPTTSPESHAAIEFATSSGSMRICVFNASKVRQNGIGLICQLLHAGSESASMKCIHRCSLVSYPPTIHEELSFPSCRVAIVSDDPPNDMEIPQLSALAAEISLLLENQLELVGTAGRAVFLETFGVPHIIATTPGSSTAVLHSLESSTPAQWEEFSFWLCNCLDTRGLWPLLLETKSTGERLRMLRELFRRAGAESVLKISSGRSWLRLRSALSGVIGLLLVIFSLWLKGSGNWSKFIDRG